MAAIYGHLEVAIALLEAKAEVNTLSDTGFTALHFAAAKGSTDLVKAILSAKARVKKRLILAKI